MARYRVVHWREIPAVVEAFEGDEMVRVSLSPRFQDLIDAVAMREGGSESDAYLEGWGQGPEGERAGPPDRVARAVADELEAGFPELVARRFGA